MTGIDKAETPYYIVTYTKKKEQKGFGTPYPKHLRMFAVWLAKECFLEPIRFVFRKSALPRWLVEKIDQLQASILPRRVRGGGWLLGQGAEVQLFESPYKFLCVDKWLVGIDGVAMKVSP